jgi:RND family efflux transporter MFP subunit
MFHSRQVVRVLGLCGLLAPFALLAATGCHSSTAQEPEGPTAPSVRAVTAVHPIKQSLTRMVEQPGFIKPYEQTPIFTKISGYALKVNVDIDDQIKEGEVLAELYVPEEDEKLKIKENQIKEAKAEIKQTEEIAKAYAANVKTSEARVDVAIAAIAKANAELTRWDAEFDRAKDLIKKGVYDKQTLDEVVNQRSATGAMVSETKAQKLAADAMLIESRANQGKAEAEVETAKAKLEVIKSDYNEWKAWLSYKTIRAPYDGKVTARNVHTGHFLQASNSGSANKLAEPLFTVMREDIMRCTFQVPEYDAVLVKKGSKAIIRFQALKNRDFEGTVTRTSYALDTSARTLLVEIHLDNKKGELRPGMYAKVIIMAKIPPAWTLPVTAVLNDGQQDYCYRVDAGKAIKTPLKIGVTTEYFVEVMKKQTKMVRAGDEVPWEDIDGKEQIIVSNPNSLLNGQDVTLEPAKTTSAGS